MSYGDGEEPGHPRPPRRYLDIAEFRSGGFLQEVNRRVLHPCGLALEVRQITGSWDEPSEWMRARLYDVAEAIRRSEDVPTYYDVAEDLRLEDEGTVTGLALAICKALWPQGSEHLSGVWDVRDDPEGVIFGEDPADKHAKADSFYRERLRHYYKRTDMFGEHPYAEAVLENTDIEPLDWVAPSEEAK